MNYLAIATDYDGTLAANGHADANAIAALQRVAARGCKLLLVTGRVLSDLKVIFPSSMQFDRVVTENGAIVFHPGSGKETLLCDPVPEKFVSALRRRGIPVATGRVIAATHAGHAAMVREVIGELGLHLQIILNKESAMVLPAGVDKGSGLMRALDELKIPAQSAIGIGDAENDEALLAACGFGVAVANAVPALKQRASLVTQRPAGAGVAEAIARIFDR